MICLEHSLYIFLIVNAQIRPKKECTQYLKRLRVNVMLFNIQSDPKLEEESKNVTMVELKSRKLLGGRIKRVKIG